MSDEEIRDQWQGCSKVITISDIYEPAFTEPITAEFYVKEKYKFDSVRETLCDEISRSSFDAFIESKTQRTNRALLPLVVRKQYFFKDAPWMYSENDILVDCGAFNGDSIKDFISLRGNQWERIIAFEPDRNNFDALSAWIHGSGVQGVTPVNAGVYREKTVLSFKATNDMESHIDADGDVKLNVERIDDVCENMDVSVIKMDIEGSELDALTGAAQIIRDRHPILMISAYHKKDDLYVLKEYIDSLYQGYSYFFRCHKPIPVDAVLYAVPPERIKEY